ncbi:relaxin-3-like [Myotis daubentonii]|uniref:relaxin-3-like n=1 Tax=Myotis daubentonii TaxID=98922 RepID=UPI002872AF50|nr:relaxin-3-like [Myotis daubentonii]
MAKHPLPLLLAVWVLVGGPWLEAESQEESDEVKVCGLDLAETIISNCEKVQQRRSDDLAQEAMGDAFPHTEPYAHSQLGEAAGSSDWRVLTKPAQDSYGSLRVTREGDEADRGSLLNKCCNDGCTKTELMIFC